MLNDLLNSPATNMLERTLNFTEARHQVILENIANVSTPGYVQKDVSVQEFQQSLQAAMKNSQQGYNVPLQPKSTQSIEFVSGSSDVVVHPKPVVTSTPFHDQGIRSMESLMGDLVDNAQVHNMAAQLLKSRYNQLTQAIQMRV